MPNSLQTTFEVLAQTLNPAAADVLVAALDVPDDQVQALAVDALVKRRPPHGIVELIRRLPTLAPPIRQLVDKPGTDLGRGLRDALFSRDAQLLENSLELVRRLGVYGELPTLVGLLQMPNVPERAAIEATIFALVNRLFEQLQFGREGDETALYLRDADRVRHQMLATLTSAAYHYPTHRCREVLEGMLILSDPENIHLKKFLREAADEARGVTAELLGSSRHPGVMGLIVDSMTQNYPLAAALAAFEKRTDPEFICHLLRHWPRKLTVFQQKNFREIRKVAWLDADGAHLDAIPPALHRTLIAFVMTTGLTQPEKLAVLEWMVRCGSPEGRLAATDVLVDLEDDKVQEVVLESLESDEPDVQAWATGQLRTWAIPNAMELLVARLDSPIPEVQTAARSELAGFNIFRAIELFDHLDSRMQLAVGKLVRKIDPDTIQKLKEELRNVIRRKRIRAARAALAMNLHLEVVEAILAMARDSDNLVRRTAAEVLGKIASRDAVDMLHELAHDASPRVRDAATSALAEIHGTHESRPSAGMEPAHSAEAVR